MGVTLTIPINGSQPQKGMRINWNNPLTQGLTICGAGDTPFEIVHNTMASQYGSAATIKAGIPGVGRSFNGSAGSGNSDGYSVVSNYTIGAGKPATMFCLAIQNTSSSGITYGIMGNFAANGFAIKPNSSGFHRFVVWDGGGQQNIASSVTVALGIPHFTVGTIDGTTSRLYVDGTQLASAATGFSSAGLSSDFGVGTAAASGFDGTIFLWGVYNRCLSASEVLQLTNNPWQIFAKEPRTWFKSFSQQKIYITSGTTFNAPGDWPGTADTIECIGGGASGGGSSNQPGTGGGGGAYSKATSIAVSNGATMQVGAGGAAPGTGANGNDGTDTWFNGANLAASSCGAKGGTKGNWAANSTAGGVGGASASGVGSTKYSGGDGGANLGGNRAGNGGGGAGGPNGAGKNGGNSAAGGGGAGGGGAGGGSATAGSPPSGGTGGNGGVNSGGSGNGVGGATPTAGSASAGTSGGGGGGSNDASSVAGAPGGAGKEWDSMHGSGGGGGSGQPAGSGGLYGGGGGGGSGTGSFAGGAGSPGIIVITYTPSGGVGSVIKTFLGLANASTKTVNGLANASIKTFDGVANV